MDGHPTFFNCWRCAKSFDAGMIACPQCGAKALAAPTGSHPTSQANKSWILPSFLGGLVALVIGGSCVITGLSERQERDLSQQAAQAAETKKLAEDAAWKAITPEQHLAEARKAVASKDLPLVRRHAAALPKEQAAPILAKAAQIEAVQKAELKRKETAKKQADFEALTQMRKSYAQQLENNFLDNGLNIDVTTQGRLAEVLHLNWVLASKVTVRQLDKNDDLWKQVRALQFRKVVLTNGLNYSHFGCSWTFDS